MFFDVFLMFFGICGRYASEGVLLRGRIIVTVFSSGFAFEVDPQTWEWSSESFELDCANLTVVLVWRKQ